MESGWMNETCCKRAATLDYSSDAKPAQPGERPRPAAAFDKRDRGAAWVGDMKGAPNGQHTTASWETNELAAGEMRLIPHSPDASPRCHAKSQAPARHLALSVSWARCRAFGLPAPDLPSLVEATLEPLPKPHVRYIDLHSQIHRLHFPEIDSNHLVKRSRAVPVH